MEVVRQIVLASHGSPKRRRNRDRRERAVAPVQARLEEPNKKRTKGVRITGSESGFPSDDFDVG
jgi:hypothetical protein